MTINAINDNINTTALPHTISDKKMSYTSHKKWLCITLAAAALTLSACGKKDTPVTEGEPAVAAQTSVEQDNTGVATVDSSNDPMLNDDVAVASANDNMANTGTSNDDVAVATADDDLTIDDSEILDGSESEEHISTY